MGAVSGDINSLAMACVDEADLASRPIASMKSGDRAYVESKAGTPEGALFFLDRNSTAVVDGVGVLATLGGVGRWLSEAMFPIPNMASVSDIEALSVLDDESLNDGGLVYVRSLRSYFQKYVVSPVPATDGITSVPTASGDGVFYRLEAPSPSWGYQSTWFIDPSGGDDENVGGPTADEALATWAEFARRVKVVRTGMDVVLTSNLSEPIFGTFEGVDPVNHYLIVQGLPTIEAEGGGSAGTSTFANPDSAALPNGTIGATTVSNLQTPLGADTVFAVNKVLWAKPATSNGGEYVAVVVGQSGTAPAPRVANTSYWTRLGSAGTTYDAPPADTIVRQFELTTVPSIQISAFRLPVLVKYVRVLAATVGVSSELSMVPYYATLKGPGTLRYFTGFFGCQLDAAVQMFSGLAMTGCVLSAVVPTLNGSTLSVRGGGSSGRGLAVTSSGQVDFIGTVLSGGTGLTVTAAGPVLITATTNITGIGRPSIGVFNSSNHGINLQGQNVTFWGNTVYGSGNAGVGLCVTAGACARLAVNPSITGAGGDLAVGYNGAGPIKTGLPAPIMSAGSPPQTGTATPWPATQNCESLSWSNWATKFGWNVMYVGDGSRVVQSSP